MAIVQSTYGGFTVGDLDNPDVPEKCVEIYWGDLIVTLPRPRLHNRVAYRFAFLFDEFCRSHPTLEFGGDNEGFWIEKNPDTLLSPDACLFRKRPSSKGMWMEFSPEIAVEILSPMNNVAEMFVKQRLYLSNGSEQVWIVDPESESIEFYFWDGRKLIATGDEEVECEGIAEGLVLSLPKFFVIN